jgi:homoserine kinase type II
LWRAAFEDETGGLFILEQIAASRRDQKQRISKALEQLHQSGFQPVAPCLRASSGEWLCFYDGFWWQITPFITGTPLSRPVYIQDARKGEALARVLGDLYRHAKKLSLDRNMPYFSLKQYILKIEQDMLRHDPDIGRRLAPIIDFLRRSFMDVHDTLPVAFCHGDYHPLNVIWQESSIAAVIDWEFCGFKPDIYDAANLVGCVDMEHPSGLTDKLVTAFIEAMRGDSAISARGWDLFPEWVVALRFAWLAEWLRKKDSEMIDLEAVYMNLLVQNSDGLKEAWTL